MKKALYTDFAVGTGARPDCCRKLLAGRSVVLTVANATDPDRLESCGTDAVLDGAENGPVASGPAAAR